MTAETVSFPVFEVIYMNAINTRGRSHSYHATRAEAEQYAREQQPYNNTRTAIYAITDPSRACPTCIKALAAR